MPENVVSTTIQSAEAQMMKHLQNRSFNAAMSIYRRVESAGGDTDLSEGCRLAFVQCALRLERADLVEYVLLAMRRSGVSPSTDFWQRVLRMLSSRKLFQTCLWVHGIFGRQLPVDKVVLSCLSNAALETGDPMRAFAIMKSYQETDMAPHEHLLFFRTYLLLEDTDAAEAMFQKLGARATPLILNLLLSTCVNTGQHDRAFRLLQEAHELESARSTKEGPLVDLISYNTVIKGLAQAGAMASCYECFSLMMAKGVKPDDITFATLLNACVDGGDMKAFHKVSDLALEQAGSLGTIFYTVLIKGLVKKGQVSDALVFYTEMKNRIGAQPDIITYSMLIKALVNNSDLEGALKIVDDMKAVGRAPDDLILTHLLEGCWRVGDAARGRKLLAEFVVAGVEPSDFTLSMMLKLLGKSGALEEAYKMVEDWEAKHGFKPTVIQYTCLMSGCIRRKRPSLAWKSYLLMRARGVLPDGTVFSTLLPGMVASHLWDNVLVLAKEVLAMERHPDGLARILGSTLAQMRTEVSEPAELQQATELADVMLAAGLAVPPFSPPAALRWGGHQPWNPGPGPGAGAGPPWPRRGYAGNSRWVPVRAVSSVSTGDWTE